ncbi:hypothetical protein Nepgr_026322 [Nepenthes gracilis]|uniref:Uncharacterized protein n=1 Tax=Nepenthes gracilis TaxID=150966 RepID=A0AAD3Y1Y8_NEPGR|nr:hypothetical protein Nepgr_026322 [Nepenthes gracilis]
MHSRHGPRRCDVGRRRAQLVAAYRATRQLESPNGYASGHREKIPAQYGHTISLDDKRNVSDKSAIIVCHLEKVNLTLCCPHESHDYWIASYKPDETAQSS